MFQRTLCPECQVALTLSDDTVEGEVVECEGCNTELEVIAVEPYELALAPEMAEDWGE
jgi:alpha-aminoadipate carrier protein LysW